MDRPGGIPYRVTMARSTTGIRRVHQRTCATRAGGACNCKPTWEASVGSGRTGKLRRSFKTEAAARNWRAEAQVALNRGTLRPTTSQTVRQAADQLIAGMESCTIRNRSGDPYQAVGDPFV